MWLFLSYLKCIDLSTDKRSKNYQILRSLKISIKIWLIDWLDRCSVDFNQNLLVWNLSLGVIIVVVVVAIDELDRKANHCELFNCEHLNSNFPPSLKHDKESDWLEMGDGEMEQKKTSQFIWCFFEWQVNTH